MPKTTARLVALGAAIATGAALAGCAESRLRNADDFGEAVRQDVASQVADPDAHYAGTPAPASNGRRVGLAQRRYVNGQVIEPAVAGTSTVSVGAAPAGGGGGDAMGASTGGQ